MFFLFLLVGLIKDFEYKVWFTVLSNLGQYELFKA